MSRVMVLADPQIPADCVPPRRGHACGGALSLLAIVFTDDATPCRKALGRMLLHPRGELRCANQAGLHRDVGEIRSGDDLLVATCRRGETAEHGDDLDHDRPPSLREALPPLIASVADVLSRSSLAGSAGGKMLSYSARACRIKRIRSSSDFGINRITSPMFAPTSGSNRTRASLVFDTRWWFFDP